MAEMLDVDDARLAVEVTGSGPPLVLVHGSAVDRRTWEPVLSQLAATHRVVSYDRRGYGESVHAPVRDHRLHGRDLVRVLEAVVGEPAVVVGWSSGGNVALATAVRRPDLVSSLVVVEAPFHGLRHANREVLATLARLKWRQLRGDRTGAGEVFLRFGTELRRGGNAYDALPEEVRAVLHENTGPLLAEWDPHPFGVMHEHVRVSDVVGLDLPLTWVLGGEGSPWMEGLHDRVVARRPATRTEVVEGASHLVHVDRPNAFVDVVRRHTAEHG